MTKPPSARPFREELLQWLFSIAIPLTTLALVAATFLFFGPTRLLVLTIWPFIVALAVSAWRRDWPYAVRAGILVAAFLYGTGITYANVGFHGNAALLGGAAVLLTGLLFGRTAMLWVLVALALVVAGVAVAMVNGLLPQPTPESTSLQSVAPWARNGCVAVVTWAILGFAVTFVVERVERSLAAERAALASLRSEEQQRRLAEEQRRQAELITARVQKLELTGQLAAGVAHDFNNILSVIQCWAELALARSPTETDRIEARNSILEATRQGSALAGQLLAFSRRNVRTVRPTELGKAVDGFVRILGRALPDDVEVIVEHGDLAMASVDEMELQQVLLNLAVNAKDAMEGRGHLRVSTGVEVFGSEVPVVHGVLSPGRWAKITVEDDGPGIEPALRERIFEPFFTTKPAGVGTGLGLATVLAIARAGGGGVALEGRRPGRGARFTLYWPELEGLEGAAGAILPQPAGGVGRSAHPGRILLVEDSPPIRELMQAILEAAGHTVIPAPDGHRAIDAIARGPFDLICTDAIIPGAPSRDVVHAFENTFRAGRVLVVSGYVDEELTRRGIEQGRYRLLRKPFFPHDLCAAVDEALGRGTV
jgi:signal transduction histidine kinase